VVLFDLTLARIDLTLARIDLTLAHVDLTLARAAVILTRVGLPFACFDLTLPRVIARGRRPSYFRKP